MYEIIKSFATSIMGATFVADYEWTIALMCVFAMCALVLPLVRLLTLPPARSYELVGAFS